MNLVKAGGTIGGLTLVSRILGFVREMIFARIMGASMAADAFTLAFLIPNLFRRLFGEGAFSQGFVPLFARRLDGEGGMAEAKRFAEEVQSVFLPLLIVITIVFMIAMPAFVGLVAAGWRNDPEKFGLAVDLTRITFPYLVFISMVSLFSGVLNSLTRFAAAAFAPALLNFALIAALLVIPAAGEQTAYALAWAVIAGGIVQLALLVDRHETRRAHAQAAAAENDAAGEGALHPHPSGNARGRRLLSQPAFLCLFRNHFARREPRLSEPGRPAQPASAGAGRIGAWDRDPARDQPPDRRRRGPAGGQYPGPGD
jgi:hypothetical protein